MKAIVIVFISIFLFTACKKEKYGNVKHRVTYTTATKSLKTTPKTNKAEQRYTQFGDYITSLTPKSFIGEMEIVRFLADDPTGSFMTLIHVQPNDPLRFADFTNNATVSITPTLNGTNILLNEDGQGGFFKNNVTFNVLWISIMNLRQVIELPGEYTDINFSQFNDYHAEKNGNILTADLIPLIHVVDGLNKFGNRMNLYFGRTDSTQIYYTKSPNDFPALAFMGNPTIPFIWSSEYSEWTLTPPKPDQTKTIVSTIGFDNSNLIQLYAGADNIPFTSDDVIVYEPNFWERINVNVSEN